MTWAKLDDQFPQHPKVIAAGGDAAWLHVCAICYCASHLTDGVFSKSIVPRLSDRKGAECLADRLVEVGLWIDRGESYAIHDYLEYNPARAQVLETRRSRSAAGRKGAESRWQTDSKSHGSSYSDRIDNVNAPDPYPTRPYENGKSHGNSHEEMRARPTEWPRCETCNKYERDCLCGVVRHDFGKARSA